MRRVSSQQMRSAVCQHLARPWREVAQVSYRRGHQHEPAPPRRLHVPSLDGAVRHLAHLELVTHPHPPALEGTGLGLDRATGPRPAHRYPPGRQPGHRTTARSSERKATSTANLMPIVCTVRAPRGAPRRRTRSAVQAPRARRSSRSSPVRRPRPRPAAASRTAWRRRLPASGHPVGHVEEPFDVEADGRGGDHGGPQPRRGCGAQGLEDGRSTR